MLKLNRFIFLEVDLKAWHASDMNLSTIDIEKHESDWLLEILTNESHYVKSLCHYVRPWDMLGNCCMTLVFSFHECLCLAHYVLYPTQILFLGISSVCFTNDRRTENRTQKNSKLSQPCRNPSCINQSLYFSISVYNTVSLNHWNVYGKT